MRNWFRLWRRRKKLATLLVTRASDMQQRPPDTDFNHICSSCGEKVGLDSTAQEAMRHYEVTLVCTRCRALFGDISVTPKAEWKVKSPRVK